MNRAVPVLIAFALASTVLAGCLGDEEDVSGAIPTAVVKVTPVDDATFLFDATGSTGKGLKYDWTFGDGEISGEAKVEHTYLWGDGTYPAELLITDLNGITDRWTGDIVVGTGENLPPEASFIPSTRYLAVDEPFTVDASATTDPESDPIAYHWDFNFLITEEAYLQFREDKKQGVVGDDGSGAEVNGGDNKSSGLPSIETVKKVAELGDKSPGHDHGGSNAPPVSFFQGLRQSDEPVFTLDEGFPDATRFYVKLVAVDIKGDFARILSEEIWPVQVVDAKKKALYEEATSGTFNLGGPSTVTDNTPDDENVPYDDEREWTFQIPDPIALMYVNVTWNEGALQSDVPNDIYVEIVSPNSKERKGSGEGGTSVSIPMTTSDALGAGSWTVRLYATSGADIQWEAEAWAKVDLDPFRDLEADYR